MLVAAWFLVFALAIAMWITVLRMRRSEIQALQLAERIRDLSREGLSITWQLDLTTDVFVLDRADLLPATTKTRAVVHTLSLAQVVAMHHPDDREALLTLIDRVRTEDFRYEFEARVIQADGTYAWTAAYGRVSYDRSTGARCLSGVSLLIERQKRAELQLKEATAAAAAASHAKGLFLANMSHEIRTPMNGVIGMTELVLDTTLTPLQRDYIGTIRDSGNALLTIINDILDFSKIEAGKLELELLDVDLRDTIEDVGRLLSIQAHDKGLELTAWVDPLVPDYVRADAGRVRQILLNLGGNAVKFTAHGEVSLEVRAVEMTEETVLARFSVRDTGIGIPADRVTSLFQPFSQVDGSTTRKFGGTGLGLSIVRRLSELMGGETGVESVQGSGSVFWFTARFARSERASAMPQSSPPRAMLEGKRVLVVDHTATTRKVLVEQLAACGANAMCAASAEDAITIMRAASRAGQPFAAALLDHGMPICDGVNLGEKIVGDEELKATRLILLTYTGQRGDASRVAGIGFAGYLLKPVTRSELQDCLAVVLSARAEEWHLQSQPLVTRHALRSLREQGKQRILLAEDNAVNEKVACRMLEKLGYRVDVARDGQAAVNAWETGRYDLILMDGQMPGMDGYEATRCIRELERARDLRRTPIVALTAHAMKGVADECIQAGMDAYLSKPIQRADLASTIERYVGDADLELETPRNEGVKEG